MPLIRKDAAPAAPSRDTRADDLSALKSVSTDARWSAARRLAEAPSSTTALGEALAVETDPRVREALFTGLAHIQTPQAVAFILPFIRSQDVAIRAGALDALNTMPEALEGELPALLADPDPDVRLLVCDIVRRLPGPIATRFLCDLLARETLANVCGAAVEALSEVGDETALDALADCAARFSTEPFLVFSIKAVSNRIAGDGRLRGPQAL
jgi:HEAT repeat protein